VPKGGGVPKPFGNARSALFLCLHVLLFLPCRGQRYSRLEAGTGIDTQTFSDDTGYSPYRGARRVAVGVGGIASLNLSPNLSVEGSVSYFPGFQAGNLNLTDSGRELTVLGGVKVGRRFGRLGVYGKIEPGLASFSCGMNSVGPQDQLFIDCERRTHFALEYGGVVDYTISPRTLLRLDVAQILMAEFDQILESGPGWELIRPGEIAQHADFRLSVMHRFGGLRESPHAASQPAQKLDVGLFNAMNIKSTAVGSFVSADHGSGAWLSWNFSRHFSWDTAAAFLPSLHDEMIQDGGDSVTVFSGLKAGIRSKRIGIFADVRPGAIVFSRTISSIETNPVFSAPWGKSGDFALDTGGVFEVYPWRRLILRADVGEGSIFYGPRTVPEAGYEIHYAAHELSSVLLQFGVGYRF
jgi:hypothetical protein